jgi:hypothetical protein
MNQTRKLEFNTKVMNPIDYIRLDGVYNGKDKRNG